MQEENQHQQIVEAPIAQVVDLQELNKTSAGPRLLDGNLSIISGIKVNLEVIVGGTDLTVEELFALQAGSVFSLDQLRDAPLSVRLDGRMIAQGRLVIVGENFGICISEVLPVAPQVRV